MTVIAPPVQATSRGSGNNSLPDESACRFGTTLRQHFRMEMKHCLMCIQLLDNSNSNSNSNNHKGSPLLWKASILILLEEPIPNKFWICLVKMQAIVGASNIMFLLYCRRAASRCNFEIWPKPKTRLVTDGSLNMALALFSILTY